MDALMIVHQLQRLAAEPRPSPAVRAKIPRMAVGICYFLEHPDPGVQHQAAGALRLLLQQHKQLLLQAPELHELRAALQQHSSSSDVVVSECCTASLALLQEGDQPQSEGMPQQQRQQQLTKDETDVETLESLDLFSVVLGLRGLLRCPSNRSLLTFKQEDQQQQQQQEQPQHNEEQRRQRVLELLQRDLQLRLVRVWGVASATVTLNTAGLLQQAAAMNAGIAAAGAATGAAAATEKPQHTEERDGVAVVNIRLSRRAQRLQQQLRELRAAVGPLTLLLNSELLQKANMKATKASPEGPPPDALPDASRSTSSDSRPSATPRQQQQCRQQEDTGYLDEDLRGNWEGTGEAGGPAGPEPTALGSTSGFSFFSTNSTLFGEAAHRRKKFIVPLTRAAQRAPLQRVQTHRDAHMHLFVFFSGSCTPPQSPESLRHTDV